MKTLVLGVIGHVDHGKTTLVGALTGEDTDRLAEEKQRGISIALGFARLLTPELAIDLIDMPGHERFVRTMISGATGIDAVLLVLAANEGVKPQTIEHIDIASLLGITQAVIAVTKTDLAPPERIAEVAAQAASLLAEAGLQALPPVMTSALQGSGIEALRATLYALAAAQPQRACNGIAFFPIDRAFPIAGHGPVVTGTLRGAPISVGDTLELLPALRTTRVRGLQLHNVRAAIAAPGQRVALNLRDVELAELRRGMALAAPQTLAPSDWLTLAIRAVDSAPPLKNGILLRAMLGTAEFGARLRLLDRDVLQPGAGGFAQLHCAEPVCTPAREHVVLRLAALAQTVAGGVVLEPEIRRQRRNYAPVLERLQDLQKLPPAALLAAEVKRAGRAGTTLRRLSQITALAPPEVAQTLQKLAVAVTRAGLVVQQVELDATCRQLAALLAPQPDGLPREKLLAGLPGISAPVLDEAIGRLLARNLVVKRGGMFAAPRPEQDRQRAQSEAELAGQIAELLQRSGLTPPDPKAIVTSLPAKRAVDRLLREGVVIRAVDRGKDREILFHSQAVEQAKRQLAPLLVQPGLLVTEIGAALGVSRKYSMPLLDYLDSIRFTQRAGDRRLRGGTD